MMSLHPNIVEQFWLVVWNMFYFSIQLGRIIPTDFHIFQGGSDHQPEFVCSFCDGNELGLPLNLLANPGTPAIHGIFVQSEGNNTQEMWVTQLGIFRNTYLFYKVDHAMISSGLGIWAGCFEMLVAPIVTVPSLHCWFFFQRRNPNHHSLTWLLLVSSPSMVSYRFVDPTLMDLTNQMRSTSFDLTAKSSAFIMSWTS